MIITQRKWISLTIDKEAIGYKQLCDTKFNSNGPINRWKARFVNFNCTQRYDINFWKLCAPLVMITIVGTLFVIINLKYYTYSFWDGYVWCFIPQEFVRGVVHGYSSKVELGNDFGQPFNKSVNYVSTIKIA